jgi:AcrR family transcriptional regulator
MNRIEDQTREKILLSALALFSERGIAKTSLNEVAYRAGVTRVTVYRHFAEKKELVREVFLRVEQVFVKGLADLKQNPQADWEEVLGQIGEGLSSLPPGDAVARMEELKRLYPDVYGALQKVRLATLNDLFEQLSIRAKRQKLMRPGLNRQMVQAIFWELVINFFDNPRFKSLGLTDVELFHAVTDIILYGILKGRPTRTRKGDR